MKPLPPINSSESDGSSGTSGDSSWDSSASCIPNWTPWECITPPTLAFADSELEPVFGKVGETIAVAVDAPVTGEGEQRTTDLNQCSVPSEISAPVPINYFVEWQLVGLDAAPTHGSGLSAAFTANDSGSGEVIFTAHPTGAEPCTVSQDQTQRAIYAFKLETETLAPQPPDKKRRVVGVAEQVVIRIVPSPPAGAVPRWTISKSKDAKLSTDEGVETTLTASSEADNVTVTCALGGFSDSVSFTVLEPGSVVMERVANPDNPGVSYEHSRWTTGVKIWAQAYVGPDNVSFMNIEVWEGTAVARATGILAGRDGQVHPEGEKIGMTVSVVPGKGTKDSFIDNISLYPVPVFESAPYTPGTFLWAIPWSYRCPAFPGFAGKEFTKVLHRGSVDADGTIHLDKAGAKIDNVKIDSPSAP